MRRARLRLFETGSHMASRTSQLQVPVDRRAASQPLGELGAARTAVPERIAVDARYLRRPGVGISNYLRSLVDDLLRAGWPLALLTDDESHGEALRETYPTAEVGVLLERGGFMWEQRALPSYLRRTRPDIYLAPANWGIPLLYYGTTRLVVIVHDLIPLRLWRRYLFDDLRWSVKYLASTFITAIRADVIIADSKATESDVRRLLRRRRTYVAYPTVFNKDRPLDQTATSETRAVHADLDDGYFLYAGGMGPRKNVPALLEAFAQLRLGGDRRRLVITGSASEVIAPQISALGLNDGVIRTGYVSDEELDLLFKNADAVVHPSLMEGFGLPVIEALMRGTPVVCGRLPAVVEAAGSLPHYADAVTADSLAEAMRTAGTDEARRSLREQAAAHFAELFN